MSTDARPAARPRDGLRQVAVAVSAVLAVLGSLVGSGALGGTPVAQAAGGALASDATLVAPAGPAFAIWSVVYLGLVALAVLQALPARRTDPRQRATGWWSAASLLLNAAWLLVVQAGLLTASVLVVAALLVVLVAVNARLWRTAPATRVEGVVVDATLGLYLGWVCVATTANAAAALRRAGVDGGEQGWAVAVLAVAAAAGVLTAVASRGRLAPAAGLAWGLAWVAAARADGGAPVVAVAAGAAAAVVVTAAAAARLSARR